MWLAIARARAHHLQLVVDSGRFAGRKMLHDQVVVA